jgi:hypothetical protein
VSFRRPGKSIREETQSWQQWRAEHSTLLADTGLPELVLCDREHWLDFVDHGCLDHHDDPTRFSIIQVSREQRRVLLRLLENNLDPADRSSFVVYRILQHEFAEDGPANRSQPIRSW